MKHLKIPFINRNAFKETDQLIHALESLERSAISCNPWPEYVSETQADFIIAHDQHEILLHYKVAEQYLIANEVNNGPIHNDSCVEFFIAFGQDEAYYNLEFNCLGFTKIGFGTGRYHRALLPVELIKQLSFLSKINSNLRSRGEGFEWEILLIIPKEIFIYHQISSFDQLKAKGNFYKCGDNLPEPHFLSWSMVNADQPDFHRTESFGLLEFI